MPICTKHSLCWGYNVKTYHSTLKESHLRGKTVIPTEGHCESFRRPVKRHYNGSIKRQTAELRQSQ